MIEGLQNLLSKDENVGEKYLSLLNTFTTANKEEYYAISSILGAFLGDSMGSYVEFKKGWSRLWKDVDFNYIGPIWKNSPGQLSDDSEMALSSAYGILDSPLKDLNPDRLMYYYGLWYLTNPINIGITTSNALKQVTNKSLYPREYSDKIKKIILENYTFVPGIYNAVKSHCEMFNNESQSNGFLMRKTPIAIYCLRFTKSEFSENEDHVADWLGFIKANEVDKSYPYTC
jgi:ADP-ribosylglycohydrolase